MSMTVGDRIRELRKARNLNQDELAELALLNRVTIAKYEAGRVEPGAQALSRLADALDVSVDDLLGREDESQEKPDPQARPPQTPEARILASGIDKMPARERERALNLVRLMFDQYSDYFAEKENDDVPGL